MNSPAIARPPGRSRLALIAAGVLALFGSLAATAPAQAGYYGDSGYGYGPRPCSSPCGYRSYAPRYYNGCSRCGCYRRCGSVSRGVVYERRFVEREYVERRYGYGGCGYSGCHSHYGGGYGRPYGGYYPYGGTRRYPWGWGGVRDWQGPYGNGYGPSADEYAGGAGYNAGPSGYESNY